MRTIGELLRERAQARPDAAFLRCGDDRMTFGEADRRADEVASGLASIGVGAGDRVAIMSPNRIEYLELFFACARLGAVQVPLNVFLKGRFLDHQLADSEPALLISDQPVPEAQLPRVDIADLPRSSDPPPPGPADADALMSIVYTSGTTGAPKGCMLPHGWYLAGAESSSGMFDYRHDDVLYTALPMYHGWARGMVTAALLHGLEAVVDPAFSAAGILDRLRSTDATILKAVGAMGMAMLAQPPGAQDRTHRLRVAQMIPFPPDAQAAFCERFGARVLAELYGQTETGAITFSSLVGQREPASVGRPSPAFDVAVLDVDCNPVPDGETGEICVRPKERQTLFAGYWRKPDDTLHAWRGLWHHTGDLGRFDERGYLRFVDRKSDALRRRGENVSSLQLEAAICAHPKIAEAAVHAVPSEMTEDDIKACIVLEPDEQTTPEELFEFFSSELPYFAIPRYVEVVESLPRTATMRLIKRELRERGVTERTWDLESLGLTVDPSARR